MSVQTTDQSLQAGGKGRARAEGRGGSRLAGREAPQAVSNCSSPPVLALTPAFPAGQFYVMMTPQDVLQTGTQRTIAPRTHPYSPYVQGSPRAAGVKGPKEGKVFWNGSQTVVHTISSQYIF